MKKRLQYAMPRVPLQKLKHLPNSEEGQVEQGTHVKTITRRIVEARKGKQMAKIAPQKALGGDFELSEVESDGSSANDSDESHLLGAAAPKHTQEEAIQMKEAHDLQTEKEKTDTVLRVTKEQFDLDEGEIRQMKRFLFELRERRKCRVESDSDGEILGMNFASCSHHADEETIHRHLAVQAIVHGVDLEQSHQEEAMGRTYITEKIAGNGNDQIIQEDAAEGNTQNKHKLKMQSNEEHGEAKPKKIINRHSRDEHKEVVVDKKDAKLERKKNRKARKINLNVQKQRRSNSGTGRQPEWGFDESSESDGGWDVEQGDIPLLPR